MSRFFPSGPMIIGWFVLLAALVSLVAARLVVPLGPSPSEEEHFNAQHSWMLPLNDFNHPPNHAPARDRSLDRASCRPGSVEVDDAGLVQSCELALGFGSSSGTHVTRGNADRPWVFRLPPDMGIAIPSLWITTPPGATLTVANDGTLETIRSRDGQTTIVRGVQLHSINLRSGSD
jgi:hypothetical protein